jgi:hypothetical protein
MGRTETQVQEPEHGLKAAMTILLATEHLDQGITRGEGER